MVVETTELDARAFGVACGLLWSGGVVVLGITARFGWGRRWERLLADVYRGYNESIMGLVTGAIWAFVDGVTGGYLLARLYDVLRRWHRISDTEANRRRSTGTTRRSLTRPAVSHLRPARETRTRR